MTDSQQPYDEWLNHLEEVVNLIRNLGTVPVLVAANSVPIFERAIEELRKRDRALELAKKVLVYIASDFQECLELEKLGEMDVYHGSDKTEKAIRALQQIEEVLK